jgi:hypothetical protein
MLTMLFPSDTPVDSSIPSVTLPTSSLVDDSETGGRPAAGPFERA